MMDEATRACEAPDCALVEESVNLRVATVRGPRLDRPLSRARFRRSAPTNLLAHRFLSRSDAQPLTDQPHHEGTGGRRSGPLPVQRGSRGCVDLDRVRGAIAG